MERIASRQNAVVKRFRELARPGARAGMLLDGPHLLAEALDAGVPVDVALFSEPALERLAELAARASAAGARTIAVPDAILAAASPVQHPAGVVATAPRHPATLVRTLERPPQLVVVLAGVQDPGNVGAIVRVAEACGATGIVTTTGCADPFGWKALRGAMGSTFRLPVTPGVPLGDAMRELRRHGIHLLATVPRDGLPLPEADLAHPSAILLGGEAEGLDAAAIEAADRRLTIPMRPPVESLNVAVAAGLILYEAERQRSAAAAVRPSRSGAAR